MSIFRTVRAACPACETPVLFELVLSVNADRRRDLREAILDGSFQREACPACGVRFRVDPEFNYIELGRRLYIGVWPLARRAEWRECAARTQQAFTRAYGPTAPPGAQELAAGARVRTVFGWSALREKLLADQAGIDDTTLEVAKLAVLRTADEAIVPGSRELRLVGVDDTMLHLAFVRSLGEEEVDYFDVPRTLVTDIEADPGTWQSAREDVADGSVVDFQRELLAG